MPYIGRNTDKLSNVEVLDNITFDGSQSYTLQKNSVNFTPSSANTILISIDGVVQAGNFTVSGSTIDFGVAVASSSTCDFILHYGVGLITTPADGTITNAKLAASAINSQTAETSIAGGDEVLIYDTSASALRKMTRTNFVSGVGGDNTPAFMAYQTSGQSIAGYADTLVSFDTELFDTDSAYDNTSGNYKFTVPSGEAGKYFVYTKLSYSASSSNRIRFFKNGSLFSDTFYDSNSNGTIDSSLIMDLSASDYIQIKAFATTSFTTYGSDQRCVFLAYKLIGV